MKLPAEGTSAVEEQVRGGAASGGSGTTGASDGGQTPDGVRAGSNTNSSSSGGSSDSSGEPSTSSSSSQPQNQQPGDVDFSEYMWMENEEEFDREVMQELVDEEMINYYYELYEASLNENGTWGPTTASLRVTGPPPPFNPAERTDDDAVDTLAQGLNSRLTINSRLNPEAAEFVPRTTNMSSPN